MESYFSILSPIYMLHKNLFSLDSKTQTNRLFIILIPFHKNRELVINNLLPAKMNSKMQSQNCRFVLLMIKVANYTTKIAFAPMGSSLKRFL